MKFLNLNQGSEEWKEWRKSVVTATDAPIIVGASPYKTPHFLYMQKKGLIPPDMENDCMKRGSLLEPEARHFYESEKLCVMEPVVVIHDEHDFLAASLDGLSSDRSVILEIKCNGKANHNLAKKGEICELHKWQMQHQMMVCDVSRCDYLSFDGSKGVIISYKRDEVMIKRLMKASFDFFICLQTDTEPELMPADLERLEAAKTWEQFL